MKKEQPTPKLSRREANKRKVIDQALFCFVEQGIENSKVSEIAERVGLTERSVFRYFATKADLVLETALLLWDQYMDLAAAQTSRDEQLCGADQVHYVLRQYAHLYFTHRNELIFIHEAEAYLNRCGKAMLLDKKPPAPYEDCAGPLSAAIHRGVEDGSVRSDVNLANLYYNTYDSLLGLIQKLAIGGWSDETYEKLAKERLEDFCALLADAYRKH